MPTHRPTDPGNPKGPSGPDLPGWSHDAPSNDFMTMHQGTDDESLKAGYELVDANVSGVAAFLVVMGVSIAVVFVLAFGIGKLINAELNRQDGPATKWSQIAGAQPGNLESNPQIEQQQLQQIVKRFPTPRLQTDDGNMDVAEMHAREDMLLNHYSWVNKQTQEVRIPITRAMQLITQKGLPVIGQQPSQSSKSKAQPIAPPQHMIGDAPTTVTAPLTDGFARTGPELEMIEANAQRRRNGTPERMQPDVKFNR